MRLQTFASLLTIIVAAVSLQACELVENIFKAGMATGIFLVFLFVAAVIFLISKVRSRV
jgi:hypothetical protein